LTLKKRHLVTAFAVKEIKDGAGVWFHKMCLSFVLMEF
jgi:hypothetical protein